MKAKKPHKKRNPIAFQLLTNAFFRHKIFQNKRRKIKPYNWKKLEEDIDK